MISIHETFGFYFNENIARINERVRVSKKAILKTYSDTVLETDHKPLDVNER